MVGSHSQELAVYIKLFLLRVRLIERTMNLALFIFSDNELNRKENN